MYDSSLGLYTWPVSEYYQLPGSLLPTETEKQHTHPASSSKSASKRPRQKPADVQQPRPKKPKLGSDHLHFLLGAGHYTCTDPGDSFMHFTEAALKEELDVLSKKQEVRLKDTSLGAVFDDDEVVSSDIFTQYLAWQRLQQLKASELNSDGSIGPQSLVDNTMDADGEENGSNLSNNNTNHTSSSHTKHNDGGASPSLAHLLKSNWAGDLKLVDVVNKLDLDDLTPIPKELREPVLPITPLEENPRVWARLIVKDRVLFEMRNPVCIVGRRIPAVDRIQQLTADIAATTTTTATTSSSSSSSKNSAEEDGLTPTNNTNTHTNDEEATASTTAMLTRPLINGNNDHNTTSSADKLNDNSNDNNGENAVTDFVNNDSHESGLGNNTAATGPTSSSSTTTTTTTTQDTFHNNTTTSSNTTNKLGDESNAVPGGEHNTLGGDKYINGKVRPNNKPTGKNREITGASLSSSHKKNTREEPETDVFLHKPSRCDIDPDFISMLPAETQPEVQIKRISHNHVRIQCNHDNTFSVMNYSYNGTGITFGDMVNSNNTEINAFIHDEPVTCTAHTILHIGGLPIQLCLP